jgi:non-heme chloroperoxidase
MVPFARTTAGQGTPAVFVHGALGDLRSWTPQARATAARHRFLSYSRRYHHPARWEPDGPPYTYLQHAADLGDLIRSTCSEPVHLVGHSYGATVALLLAVKEPALIRSLVLSEPAAAALLPPNPKHDELRSASHAGYEPVRAAAAAGDDAGAVRRFMGIVNGDPEVFDRFLPATQAVLLANASTLGPMLAAPGPIPVTRDDLAQITVPALLVRSERPTPLFEAVLDYIAASIPGIERATIAGTSHGLTYQNPGGFNAALLEFLARH